MEPVVERLSAIFHSLVSGTKYGDWSLTPLIAAKGKHSRVSLAGDEKPQPVDFGGDCMIQVIAAANSSGTRSRCSR
jgi:hypothetical protein